MMGMRRKEGKEEKEEKYKTRKRARGGKPRRRIGYC
jgi:hypothetical protein